MNILLTSFRPFGGDCLNASQEVMNALPDRIEGALLNKLCLPVSFRAASEVAVDAAERLRPDAIVSLGQAGGRDCITPERVAVNLMDAAITDNDGYAPADLPVIGNAPAAYFSTLPVKAMVEEMQNSGIPARLSNTAGTYVCNSLMYSMLHWTHTRGLDVPCGFIHVPYLDVQHREEGVPALPKETAVRGILACLDALVLAANRGFTHETGSKPQVEQTKLPVG